jgi:hypothetical protein
MSSFSCLARLVVFVLLTAGLLLKPVCAVECALDDGPRPFAVSMGEAGIEAADSDCCARGDCEDCCSQVAVPANMLALLPSPPATERVHAPAVEPVPMTMSRMLRPPIAA